MESTKPKLIYSPEQSTELSAMVFMKLTDAQTSLSAFIPALQFFKNLHSCGCTAVNFQGYQH